MPELELEELVDSSSNEVKKRASLWTFLPFELWIIIVDYGLTARDLVNLDYCCKWFSNTCRGKVLDLQ